MIILLLQQLCLVISNSSNLKNLRNNRNKSSRKPKDDCNCECKQKVIAMEKIVEIPRVQIVEESDDTHRSFHDFKLYKLAKNFESIDQQAVDMDEVKRLLEREGLY